MNHNSPKAEVTGSNPVGRANEIKDLTSHDGTVANAASAACPRNRFDDCSGDEFRADKPRPPDDPPDRKKRRPRSVVATEQGPSRKSKSSQKVSKPKARASQEGARHISIYAGRERLASVRGTSGAFSVVMVGGLVLGRFDTLAAVRAAVSAVAGGAR